MPQKMTTQDKAQCRLCLRAFPNTQLQQLFIENDPEQLLQKCLTICPFIKDHPGFPNKICNTCEDYVIFFQVFQQRCFENEILIRKNMHNGTSVPRPLKDPGFDDLIEALEDEQEIPIPNYENPGPSKVDNTKNRTTNIPLQETPPEFHDTDNETSGSHLIQDDTMLSRVVDTSNEEIVQMETTNTVDDKILEASGFEGFPPSDEVLPEICGYEEVNFIRDDVMLSRSVIEYMGNIPEPINEDVVLETFSDETEQQLIIDEREQIDTSGYNLREFTISIEKLDLTKLMKNPNVLIGYDKVVDLRKFYDLKVSVKILK